MANNGHIPGDLMRSSRQVGIIGYGAYIPRYRLPGTEVARVWTKWTRRQSNKGKSSCRA